MNAAVEVDTKAALATAANEERGLAMYSIAAAHSGHMRLPLGAAEIGATIYGGQVRNKCIISKWNSKTVSWKIYIHFIIVRDSFASTTPCTKLDKSETFDNDTSSTSEVINRISEDKEVGNFKEEEEIKGRTY